MEPRKSVAYFGFNSGASGITRFQEQQGVSAQLQDQASKYVDTDVGIQNYAKQLQRVYPWKDVVALTNLGQDPTKQYVLESLSALVRKQNKWLSILIHYNGHGTVSPKEIKMLSANAGKWCCANNEYITIEEVLTTIDKSYQGNNKIAVSVLADCCGAAGAYDRLLHKLHTKKLKLSKIRGVYFTASAQYWQKSYAGERGGKLTECYTTLQIRDHFISTKESTTIGGIFCALDLRLHKDTIENER